jgi:hypothetical protein
MMGEATTSTASAFNAFPVLLSWANPGTARKMHRATPNHPVILGMILSPFANAFFGFHSAGTSLESESLFLFMELLVIFFTKSCYHFGKK